MDNEKIVKNNIFGFGKLNSNYSKYFIGDSYLNSLVNKEDGIDISVSNVNFEPGCRNNWHIHHNGYQILLVTAGEGWYQEYNHSAKKLTAGDVVVIREGIKHWHGATKDSWFSHIAITKGNSEWLEKVDDQQYEKLEDEK